MFELDGSLLWTQTITDASGLAGCSGYDVNGDGAYEVLFADENTFWLFDGSTGGVLFSQLGHASGTIFEYPIVADIDNDDSAEIVISSNNFRMNGQGWAGITVFGHLGMAGLKRYNMECTRLCCHKYLHQWWSTTESRTILANLQCISVSSNRGCYDGRLAC